MDCIASDDDVRSKRIVEPANLMYRFKEDISISQRSIDAAGSGQPRARRHDLLRRVSLMFKYSAGRRALPSADTAPAQDSSHSHCRRILDQERD
jgi:hypothetical protein